MKGYPVILQKPQKRWVRHRHSGAFRKPRWEPSHVGSNTFVLVGDEIERDLKTIFRIGWKESYRDDSRKVCKANQHIMDVQYWDVVAEFQELVSTQEYALRDAERAITEFVWELGDEKIHKRICKLFLTEEKAQFVEDRVFAKWLPVREIIVREYVATEEFKVWLKCEAMRNKRRRDEERRAAEEERARERSRQHHNSQDTSSLTKNGADPEMAWRIILVGYRELAKQHHPDKGGDVEIMKILNTTYEGLKKTMGR